MSAAESMIVIVESDAGTSRTYAKLAGAASSRHTVVSVADLGSAWSLIQRGTAGILVLGSSHRVEEQRLRLLRRLRFEDRPVDVIVISSDSTPDAVRQMQRLGVADYLISPVVPERFLQSVRQLTQVEGRSTGALCQSDIDRIRSSQVTAHTWMPREISAERLASVRAYVSFAPEPLSAAAVGQALGLARVTARRYLEFLVTLGELEVDSVAERPGRPYKLYERCTLSIAN